MKFFHVYNDWHIKGLEKNNLINEDTGFKIQHAFSVPGELKFNKIAAKGGNRPKQILLMPHSTRPREIIFQGGYRSLKIPLNSLPQA